MKPSFILLTAVILSACVRPVNVVALAEAADMQCRLANSTFADYELCARTSVAMDKNLNTGPNVDLVTRYLAGLRVLSGRVAKGEIDDGQAFWVSAEYYGMLKETLLGRVAVSAQMGAQAEAARQRRAEFLGRMGLGLMELGQPRVLGTPPRSITCVQQGVFTTCN